MSGYPTSDDERRVDCGRLLTFVQNVFERCDMEPADAGLLSDSLVSADLRGVHSHGLLRVPEYVGKLTTRGVNAKGRPRIVRESGAVLVVDGDNAMGQIAASYAMDQAIERAQRNGVGVAAVRGSNHCGAMAYFAMQALPHDMIGIAATNALPTMAPWGGLDKIVGINPMAAAVPTGEEPAIVLDAAFAGSSHGKIRVFQQKGLDIPSHWAFDSNGAPTTDAAKAVEGLLQPIGQFKGVGLAIVMGVLSSLLSGSAYGTELGNMVDGAKPGQDGHFLLALNVDAFCPAEELKRQADGVVREIRESRAKDGVEHLYAPGGLEAATEARYRSEGIPLNNETVAGLVKSAEAVGAPSQI